MVLYLDFRNRSNFTDLLWLYKLNRKKIEGMPVTLNLSAVTLEFHTVTLFVIVIKRISCIRQYHVCVCVFDVSV